METDTALRMRFIGLDSSQRELLLKNKDRVLNLMPPILSAFYEHVGDFEETRRFFRDPEHMEHAKAAQLRHWGIILDARFDEAYATSVTRIGEVHNKLGLKPRWYIGAYSFLMCGLNDRILTDADRGRFRLGKTSDGLKLINALTNAAMLDMDYALSVYIDAGIRDRRETLEMLSRSFQETVGPIANDLGENSRSMATSVSGLAQTARDAKAQSQAVSEHSEESSARVQTLAAATEELSASVVEIGRQAEESYSISDQAVSESGLAIKTVQSLTQAANRVGEIVNLINDIAEKTNLLALNATIEAARAGEAGRGFAVVAAEVKDLAGQTARATAEIGKQIEGMQQATESSANAINNVNRTIEKMNEITAMITAAVEQQKLATDEIGENIQLAADGSQKVSGAIGDIANASSKFAVVSDDLLDASQGMAGQAGRMLEEMAGFANKVTESARA